MGLSFAGIGTGGGGGNGGRDDEDREEQYQRMVALKARESDAIRRQVIITWLSLFEKNFINFFV
jgi:hypothetical protein